MSTFSGQIRCKKMMSYNAAKGKDLYRISPYRYTTFNRAYFVSMAAADAGITEEQMSAALRAYQTQFDQLLLNGHSLQLEGLGNFRLSMSFKAAEEIEDVNIDSGFERLRVVLRPSKELRDEMKSINHIVDPIVTAKSGNSLTGGNFFLNHQIPFEPLVNKMRIYVDKDTINLSGMTNLFFIVTNDDYGDLKLIANTPSLNEIIFEDEDSVAHMKFNFTAGNYVTLTEFAGFNAIKMFGGN